MYLLKKKKNQKFFWPPKEARFVVEMNAQNIVGEEILCTCGSVFLYLLERIFMHTCFFVSAQIIFMHHAHIETIYEKTTCI